MGVIFDGVVWARLAMIWAWLVGVAIVLEPMIIGSMILTVGCFYM